MQPVWQRLADLGIPTGDEWMVTAPRGVTREVRGTPEEPPVAKAHPISEPEHSSTEEVRSPGLDSVRTEEVVPGSVTVRVDDVPGRAAEPVEPAEPETPVWTPPAWYLESLTPSFTTSSEPAAGEPDAEVPPITEEFQPPSWYLPAPVDSPQLDSVQPEPIESAPLHPGSVHPASVAAETSDVMTTTATESSHAGVIIPQPYRSWNPRTVPPVDSGSRIAIMEAMSEIIEAEGPIHAQRVYQQYVKASGGWRVGREAQRTFVALTASGVRTGIWLRVKDRISDPAEATLYMPGHPAVAVRERGPRELDEIPRSEIRSLVDQLELSLDDPDLKRALLQQLGFVRLTARASAYLDQCLRYSWTT